MLLDIPEILANTKVIPLSTWIPGYYGICAAHKQKPSHMVINDVCRVYDQVFEHWFLEQYFLSAKVTKIKADMGSSQETTYLLKDTTGYYVRKFNFIENRWDETFPIIEKFSHFIEILVPLGVGLVWRDKLYIKD